MIKYSNQNMFRLFFVLAIIFVSWTAYTIFRRYSLKEGLPSDDEYMETTSFEKLDIVIGDLSADGMSITDRQGNTYEVTSLGNIVDKDGNATGHSISEDKKFIQHSPNFEGIVPNEDEIIIHDVNGIEYDVDGYGNILYKNEIPTGYVIYDGIIQDPDFSSSEEDEVSKTILDANDLEYDVDDYGNIVDKNRNNTGYNLYDDEDNAEADNGYDDEDNAEADNGYDYTEYTANYKGKAKGKSKGKEKSYNTKGYNTKVYNTKVYNTKGYESAGKETSNKTSHLSHSGNLKLFINQ